MTDAGEDEKEWKAEPGAAAAAVAVVAAVPLRE